MTIKQKARHSGFLTNYSNIEGMAVRIRLSFVSIITPLTEDTGGAAGRSHGRRSRPAPRMALGRVKLKAPPGSEVSGA